MTHATVVARFVFCWGGGGMVETENETALFCVRGILVDKCEATFDVFFWYHVSKSVPCGGCFLRTHGVTCACASLLLFPVSRSILFFSKWF